MSITDAVRDKIMKIKEGTGTRLRDVLQYGGMDVDVTDDTGSPLFKATVSVSPGGAVTLDEMPGYSVDPSKDYIQAEMRGYSPQRNKTVRMRGTIHRLDDGVWTSPDLTVTRVVSDRTFFRMRVRAKGTVKPAAGGQASPCELSDISVGGARIASVGRFKPGESVILTVDLDGGGHTSEMECKVVRVSGSGVYVYNCSFTSMDEETKKRLTRDIFNAQVKSPK